MFVMTTKTAEKADPESILKVNVPSQFTYSIHETFHQWDQR